MARNYQRPEPHRKYKMTVEKLILAFYIIGSLSFLMGSLLAWFK